MKRVPDLLTASRGGIALVIASLGLVGPRALEAVILLTILGGMSHYTVGWLLGWCQRNLPTPGQNSGHLSWDHKTSLPI